MWAALMWIAKAAYAVVTWATAHVTASIAIGAALVIGGAWVQGQDWAGATLIGDVLGFLGTSLLTAGLIGSASPWLGRWFTLGAAVVSPLSAVGVKSDLPSLRTVRRWYESVLGR